MSLISSCRSKLIWLVGLLILLVVIRGVNLSVSLPPFEGWDEYQHLSVAEFVHLNNAMPVRQDRLPDSVLPFLKAFPHPDDSAKQLNGLAAINYSGAVWDNPSASWRSAVAEDESKNIPTTLYQSQHGPLYYQFLSIIKQLFGVDDFNRWSLWARLINVFLCTIAVACWIQIFFQTMKADSVRYPLMIVTLLAVNPLLIYNASRVANDSMASAFACLALMLYFQFKNTCYKLRDVHAKEIIWCGVIGLLIGCAVLTKANAIVVAPVIAIGLYVNEIQRGKSIFLAAVLPCVLTVSYFLVTAEYHYDSLIEYGNLTGMQESKVIKDMGKGLGDVVMAISEVSFSFIKKVYFYGFFDIGGWSEGYRPEIQTELKKMLLKLIMVVFFLAIFVQSMRKNRSSQKLCWELVVLLALIWMAMLYHALSFQVAWGSLATNTHYGIMSIPVLIALVLGIGFFSPKIVFANFCLIYVYSIGIYYWSSATLIAHTQGASFSGVAELFPF